MTLIDRDNPAQMNLYLAKQWYNLASYWAEEPQTPYNRRQYIKCKIEAFLYLNKAKEYSNDSPA